MVTIEPLRLTRERVTPDPKRATTMTWYGFSTAWGLHWGTHERILGADEPDYRCEVVLPALMVGSPSETRSDIARALRLHAESLGLGGAGEADD